MPTMTRAEALAAGFTIDNGQRPIAYRGPRFNPTDKADVRTEHEEALLARITRLRAALQEIAASDLHPHPTEIAIEALAEDDREIAR